MNFVGMSPVHCQMTRGKPSPLGAHFDGEGVNFAVFSAHADKVELCLFDETGAKELQRLALPERQGDIWHGYVSGLKPGTVYGFRVHGAYAPEQGHRFNPNKLLLDPYARKLVGSVTWSEAVLGYQASSSIHDLSFDTRDSAPFVPKSVVIDEVHQIGEAERPTTDPASMVIYESHVKGLTAERQDVDPSLRGTFLGMASDPVIEHLTRLGINTVELLPVQAFVDDRFLVEQGLRNYWGYQTIGFFSPDPRYLSDDNIAEFRHMVQRFHAAGIKVIVDVVYNHTAEGHESGPTLSFRGLDNRSYYRLDQTNPRYYENHAGTGNCLNLEHPMVSRLVLDSLRYWVETMHVDGFRFDLATVLGRSHGAFDRNAPFFQALLQDPVLSQATLIAEPWDIGPGGYQLGGYPVPFREWNDRYRDDVRRFWRGDEGMTARLAERLSGSAREFDHSGRRAIASVNFITSHDGFTLQDLVSYKHKHNEANGEGNSDGHNDNNSDNFGVEGPTKEPEILKARARRKRNLLATLLLSQGTPMLLAGDEIGNSQSGNNNAYCQDNEIGWVNWDDADKEFLEFTRKLIAVRKAHPVLRQRFFLHGNQRPHDGITDLFWRMPEGREPTDKDWHDPNWRCLCVEIRMASNTPAYDFSEDEVFVVLNGGKQTDVVLPAKIAGTNWVHMVDTADAGIEEKPVLHSRVRVAADSVCVFALKSD